MGPQLTMKNEGALEQCVQPSSLCHVKQEAEQQRAAGLHQQQLAGLSPDLYNVSDSQALFSLGGPGGHRGAQEV